MSEPEKQLELPRGFSMRIGVGCMDGTQVELTATLRWDDRGAILDEVLDRLIAAAQRQARMASVPALMKERVVDAAILEQNQQKLDKLEREFEAATADRENTIAELVRKKTKKQLEYSEEWVASGKRGEFVPSGGQQGRLNNFDTAIKVKQAEQQKAYQDFAPQQSQIANDIIAKRLALAEKDGVIAQASHLTNGHDPDGA